MPKPFGNTQDLVDVKEIRDGAIVLKNGSLRQIIMVGGVNFALKSEVEQNIITSGYQNFLNGIDFPLQIIIHSRKANIERYLEGLSRGLALETSLLLQNQAEEYKEFVRGFVQKNAIMEKVFFLVIPFYPLTMPSKESVSNIGSMLPFMKRSADQNRKAAERARAGGEATFAESLQQLRQRVAQVMDGLSAMGLEAAVLNDEQLIELFYNFYNPETIEKESANRMAQQ